MDAKVKVYSVIYWATDGIVPVEGKFMAEDRFMSITEQGYYQSLSKHEFAPTLEEARGKAEALRNKKIVSLTKQLDKVKKMKIKEPNE